MGSRRYCCILMHRTCSPQTRLLLPGPKCLRSNLPSELLPLPRTGTRPCLQPLNTSVKLKIKENVGSLRGHIKIPGHQAMSFNPSPAIGFLSVTGASLCLCFLIHKDDYSHLPPICGSRELSTCHRRNVSGKHTLREENGVKSARIKALSSLDPMNEASEGSNVCEWLRHSLWRQPSCFEPFPYYYCCGPAASDFTALDLLFLVGNIRLICHDDENYNARRA